jgi:hypothetical protein
MNTKWLLPALVLALIGTSTPCSATILWAGGEDVDFTIINSVTTDSTAGSYNSTYSRGDVSFACNASVFANTATAHFPSSSTFWLHGYYTGNTVGNGNAGDILWLLDGSSVRRLILNQSAAGLNLIKRTAAGVSTTLVTYAGSFQGGAIDLYVNDAVSGTFTLYLSGNQVATYSGDTTTDSVSSLSGFTIGNNASGCAATYRWSEMIVATTDTRNKHLVTVKPVANGNAMAWTGVVSSINPLNYNDANNISSGTAGQIAEFTIPSLPAGNYSIDAVVQSARATASLTGPQNLQFDVRTGGTDYQSANQLLTTGFQSDYYYVWSTNPNTGVAWTSGDLGAAGFNLGVESQN